LDKNRAHAIAVCASGMKFRQEREDASETRPLSPIKHGLHIASKRIYIRINIAVVGVRKVVVDDQLNHPLRIPIGLSLDLPHLLGVHLFFRTKTLRQTGWHPHSP
jgi:hypothetical protein